MTTHEVPSPWTPAGDDGARAGAALAEGPPGPSPDDRTRMHRSPEPRLLAGERVLFDAVLAFTWKALARHRLSDADRNDVTQEVALVVLRRRASYRAARGTPEQWLRGIIRLEVKKFLRLARREPALAADEPIPEPAVQAATPEESASLHDLAERRLAMLPDDLRRAVVLVEVDGLTFREVAAREGISASTAFDRHQRGLASLRASMGRGEGEARGGALLFPLFAGDERPPPDFVEQAWRRAVVELGLLDTPEVEPPASGVRHVEEAPADDAAPPSSTWRIPRLSAPPALGARAAACIASLLCGVALGRCTAERPREDGSPVTAIAFESEPSRAAGGALAGAVPAEAVPARRPGTPVGEPLQGARPAAEHRPAVVVAVKDDGKEDREILRQARIAIVQGDTVRALALLGRVRSSRFATSRDQLRDDALALHASAGSATGMP